MWFTTRSLAALIPLVLAQQINPQFRSEIQLVPLTVTVTGANGRYVSGLTVGDFTVLDEGRPQPVSYFASTDSPIDLTLLLDVSGSMIDNLSLAQRAASGLAGRLRSGDRVAVAGVSTSVVNLLELTEDKTRIAEAIRSLKARGNTALYEAMYIMLRELERNRRAGPAIRRQAMIALSDGVDTASHVDFDYVREYMVRGDVVLYVVLLQDEPSTRAIDRAQSEALSRMVELVRATGGRLFRPEKAADLPAIYDAIGDELAGQYLLGYTPPQGRDGEFRRISVHVRHSGVLQARTRAGYFAMTPRHGVGLRPEGHE